MKKINIIHKWIKMSKVCTSGWKIKHANIIHKWLKGYTIRVNWFKIQHYTQVDKRLSMAILYPSGLY